MRTIPTRQAPPGLTVRGAAAGGLWLLTVLAGIGNVAGSIERGDGPADVLMFAILSLDALACASMGTLITFRRPGNRIGLLLTLVGAGIAVTFFSWANGSVRTFTAGPDDLVAGLLSWSGSVAFFPTLTALGLVVLLFPDGRLPSAPWRLPTVVTLVAVIAGTAIQAVIPGRVDQYLGVNPFGVDMPAVHAVAPFASPLSSAGVAGMLLLGVAAVARRFRSARGDTRQQLKWFLGAVAVFAGTFALESVDSGGDAGGAAYTVASYLSALSISLLPVAIAVAVLRYRLYSIDRIISRTLGWAIVTAVLVGAFAMLVVGLQAVLAGVTSTNAPAVAASTLVVAALFQPVRRRVQTAVDRRFDRSRYDAARVVEGFSGRLRHELDLTTLGGEIERVAEETVRPASARVWLRPGRGA
jgi:hypothetical protein